MYMSAFIIFGCKVWFRKLSEQRNMIMSVRRMWLPTRNFSEARKWDGLTGFWLFFPVEFNEIMKYVSHPSQYSARNHFVNSTMPFDSIKLKHQKYRQCVKYNIGTRIISKLWFVSIIIYIKKFKIKEIGSATIVNT